MLVGRRTRLHAAVAEALIELDADRLDEEAAVIAWHWARAGCRVDAAQWNLRAGRFALRSDLAEALRRWRAAVELLEGIEETSEALRVAVRARILLLQYGARGGMEAAEMERLEADGRAMSDLFGDAGLSAHLVFASGAARFLTGRDIRGGLARHIEAARRAHETDDPDLRAAMLVPPSFVLSITGPLDEGLAWSDRVLAACAGDPERGVRVVGYSALVKSLQGRADLLARAGRLPEARTVTEQAITLLRDRCEPEGLSWSLPMLPLLAQLSGDLITDTTAPAAEAVRLAEETGNALTLVLALEGQALTDLMAGRPAAAAAACERALAVGRERRSGLFAEASVLAHLALSRHAAGDSRAAASAADEAVEVARRQGARVHECLALLTRARVGRSRGGSTEAVGADLDAALTLVGEVGALTYEPFIREELGRVHADESELREAARLYTAIGATGHARRLGSELAGSEVDPRR
jgi:adenylate cyclase